MHTQSDYLELEFYDDFVSEESPETETVLEQGLSATALESIFGHLLRRSLLTPEEEMELLARQGGRRGGAGATGGVESAAGRQHRATLCAPRNPSEDLVQEGALA